MKKGLFLLSAAALFLSSFQSIRAQDILEVKRVELDSLVSFIKKEITPSVFHISNPQDHATFDVRAERDGFIDAAAAALEAKGYKLSKYDKGIYILHGKSIKPALPAGYFASGSGARDDSAMLEYLAAQNLTVTFQNKIYEIGDPDSGKTGKAYLSGHVRDVSSGEPLVGVSVYDNANNYTMTDNAGFYRLLLPIGENVINFSGYSMEDARYNVVMHDDGGLDIVMKEKVTALSGAVVSADRISNHRDARMGIEKVHINIVNKIPTAFGEADILKVVLSLPGVKSVGEASSGFNVRGGTTDQNLILFNDCTIYNPSHMFGVFSAFNTDVINDVELYKSSIPAQYGGRISSVLEIKGREGNSNKLTGSLGIGLLTGRFHLEGPIKKGRTTFIVGGRTTYSNWLLNLIPKGTSAYSGGRAGFSDFNASISHKVNEKNSLHAYAYLSRDNFSFDGDTSFAYANINAALRWRSHINERNTMDLSAGYDNYHSSIDNTFNEVSGYTVKSGIRQGFLKLAFTSTASEHHTFSYGLNNIYYMLNPGKRTPLKGVEYSLVKEMQIPEQNALESALYFSDNWTVDDRLSFDMGLRLSGFLALHPNKFYGAPEIRLSGKYSFRDNLSVKAGFNSMTQYIHLISNTSSVSPMDYWFLSGDKVKPQQGWQAASGLYWTVADGKVDLSLEAYYKRSSNYLDYKSGATLIMNPNLADDVVGTYCKAYGIELMVKKPVGKLNGWVSYSYSRALMREMENRGVETINNGQWYNAPHDRPHDFKFVGNYKFTHRYSLSINIDYATGRPVTVPIGQYTYWGGKRLAYSERNAFRIPDYFRMDVAMNIEPSHYLKKLTHLSFTIGVYNVTGRKNAYSVYYTTDGGGEPTGHLLSVFACPVPYVNLNLKF